MSSDIRILLPLTTGIALQMSISRELLRHLAFSREFQSSPTDRELVGIGIDPVKGNSFAIQYELSTSGVIERIGFDDGNIASSACRIAIAYLLCLCRGRHRSWAAKVGIDLLSRELNISLPVLAAVVLAHRRALSTENDSVAHRAIWPKRIMRGRGLGNSTHFAEWRSEGSLICSFEFSVALDRRISDVFFMDHTIPSESLRVSLPLLAQAVEGATMDELDECHQQAYASASLPEKWRALQAKIGPSMFKNALHSLISGESNARRESWQDAMEWDFHFEFPYHEGIAAHVTHRGTRRDYISGDCAEIGLVIHQDVVDECFFNTGGSTGLCRASASMIAERVEGMSVDTLQTSDLSNIISVDLDSELFAPGRSSIKAPWLALKTAISKDGSGATSGSAGTT